MIPNLIYKAPIPKQIPKDMIKIIKKIKKTRTKKECLNSAYAELAKKFYGTRTHILFKFYHLFSRDIETIWKRKGPSHCITLNYLLRILLLKSKKFNEKDIRLKWTMVYISPHQYLKIYLDKNKFTNVDLWAISYGLPLGKYAKGWVRK